MVSLKDVYNINGHEYMDISKDVFVIESEPVYFQLRHLYVGGIVCVPTCLCCINIHCLYLHVITSEGII